MFCRSTVYYIILLLITNISWFNIRDNKFLLENLISKLFHIIIGTYQWTIVNIIVNIQVYEYIIYSFNIILFYTVRMY